jgi:crotonobetainyl-CoA:carnitine CoA-transferase CaiB-like acyl-CoA transferase
VKLEGIRVVDLSQFLPGPHLTMMMADHGAEVIKVEVPGEGDPTRHIGPAQDGHTAYFRNTNRGKKSVVVNLKEPSERDALLRLLATADVVVETYRPGVAARLGVDYDTVAAGNPRVVYASISAFGQAGPRRDLPAHDLAVEALSGILSLNLGSDGEPTMPAVLASDMAASLIAFGGIMMALYRREKTGRGDYLDISMLDSMVGWLPYAVGSVFVDRRPPDPRRERLWGGGAFYRIYRTRDGRHVVLGAQELRFVRNLLDALGRPDLVALAERGPGPHQQPLVEFLEAQFAQRTQAEWEAWFAGRDVGFAPVRNLREALEEPQVKERSMVIEDDRGVRHLGVPIKFREEPAQPRLAVPALGEHNDELLDGRYGR